MNQKLLIKFGGIWLSPLPLVPVIACAATPAATNENLPVKEYQEIKTFLGDKPTHFVAKPTDSHQLKGIKTLNNTDLKVFQTELAGYLTLNADFVQFLSADNSRLFKAIKQVVISPLVNTKTVKVIFKITEVTTDLNQIVIELQNYFDQPFSYAHPVAISKHKVDAVLATKDEFNEKFAALSADNLMLIEKAFKVDSSTIKTHFDKLEITKDANFRITLRWKPAAIDQGFIFKIATDYYPAITSDVLAKEK